MSRSPSRLIAEKPGSERDRILDADAAVAEITSRSRKQLRGRRAMHVNVMRIWEVKFQQSQGVVRTRHLSNAQLSGTELAFDPLSDRTLTYDGACTCLLYTSPSPRDS